MKNLKKWFSSAVSLAFVVSVVAAPIQAQSIAAPAQVESGQRALAALLTPASLFEFFWQKQAEKKADEKKPADEKKSEQKPAPQKPAPAPSGGGETRRNDPPPARTEPPRRDAPPPARTEPPRRDAPPPATGDQGRGNQGGNRGGQGNQGGNQGGTGGGTPKPPAGGDHGKPPTTGDQGRGNQGGTGGGTPKPPAGGDHGKPPTTGDQGRGNQGGNRGGQGNQGGNQGGTGGGTPKPPTGGGQTTRPGGPINSGGRTQAPPPKTGTNPPPKVPQGENGKPVTLPGSNKPVNTLPQAAPSRNVITTGGKTVKESDVLQQRAATPQAQQAKGVVSAGVNPRAGTGAVQIHGTALQNAPAQVRNSQGVTKTTQVTAINKTTTIISNTTYNTTIINNVFVINNGVIVSNRVGWYQIGGVGWVYGVPNQPGLVIVSVGGSWVYYQYQCNVFGCSPGYFDPWLGRWSYWRANGWWTPCDGYDLVWDWDPYCGCYRYHAVYPYGYVAPVEDPYTYRPAPRYPDPDTYHEDWHRLSPNGERRIDIRGDQGNRAYVYQRDEDGNYVNGYEFSPSVHGVRDVAFGYAQDGSLIIGLATQKRAYLFDQDGYQLKSSKDIYLDGHHRPYVQGDNGRVYLNDLIDKLRSVEAKGQVTYRNVESVDPSDPSRIISFSVIGAVTHDGGIVILDESGNPLADRPQDQEGGDAPPPTAKLKLAPLPLTGATQAVQSTNKGISNIGWGDMSVQTESAPAFEAGSVDVQ